MTKDVAALLKWAVTGPELVRVSLNLPLWQIEKVLLKVLIMNEPTNATQKRFVSQVNALVDVLKSIDSPFEEESDHLVRLHSTVIMDHESVECFSTVQLKGQEHIEEFVNDHLKINTKPLTATINRNKAVLFNKQSYRSKKGDAKINLL